MSRLKKVPQGAGDQFFPVVLTHITAEMKQADHYSPTLAQFLSRVMPKNFTPRVKLNPRVLSIVVTGASISLPRKCTAILEPDYKSGDRPLS